MNRDDYCPFCNIKVAPFDGERLERGGKAAHSSHVRANALPHVHAAVLNFLAVRDAVLEIRPGDEEPRRFALLLRSSLDKLLAKSASPREREEICHFASQVADRLYVDIELQLPAAQRA